MAPWPHCVVSSGGRSWESCASCRKRSKGPSSSWATSCSSRESRSTGALNRKQLWVSYLLHRSGVVVFFFFFFIWPTPRKWAEHDISLTEGIQWSKLSLSLSFYCKAKWHHKISFTINLFLPPKQQTYEPIYVNLMMILDHILNTCCYLVRLMLVSVVSVRAG